MLYFNAQLVSKGHLADCLGDSAGLHSVGRDDVSGLHIAVELLVAVHHLAVNRKVIAVLLDLHHHNLASGLLKLRRYHMLFVGNVYSKGDKCRRNIDLPVNFIVEGSGHTVLSSDGRKSEAHLCAVCTEESGERRSPSGSVLCHPLEILLEGEADLLKVASVSRNLGNRIQDGIDSPVIRAPA